MTFITFATITTKKQRNKETINNNNTRSKARNVRRSDQQYNSGEREERASTYTALGEAGVSGAWDTTGVMVKPNSCKGSKGHAVALSFHKMRGRVVTNGVAVLVSVSSVAPKASAARHSRRVRACMGTIW
jgi:hypothetical protein